MADRADGSVLIKAVVDADNAEKELNKLKKKIGETERAIETAKSDRLPLAEKLDEVSVRLDQAKAKLREMKNATAGAFGKDEIAEQAETVRAIQSEFNKAASAVEKIDGQIDSTTKKLTIQKNEAGELVQKIESVSAGTRTMARAQEEAQKSAKRFGLRIREVVRSALVFTIITQTLAKFREWMGAVIKTNGEATAAVSRLKGALLTLARPLVDVILPAFVALVDVLTGIVTVVASLLSAIQGVTIEESAKAAESLNKETEALDGVGAAAKKATKYLAPFDEINKLTAGTAGNTAGIQPDFAFISSLPEWLKSLTAAIGVKINEIKMEWDNGTVASSKDFWAAGLSGLLGAVIGGHFGGITGSIIGLLMGITIGLASCSFIDRLDNPGKYKDLFIVALGSLLGSVIGAMFAGVTGSKIGLVMGVAVAIAAIEFTAGSNVKWDEDKFIIVALSSIIGGILGGVFGGIKGAVIGLVMGAAISIAAIEFSGGNFDANAAKASLRVALFAILGAVMGAMFGGLAGATIGALLGLTIGFATVAFDKDISAETQAAAKSALKIAMAAIVGALIGAVFGGGVFGGIIGGIIGLTFGVAIKLVADSVDTSGLKTTGASSSQYMSRSAGYMSRSVDSALSDANIPQLARGAVIPPNREFLAVLGDQKSGTNIETPLSTMVQAFKQAMAESGGVGGQNEAYLVVGDDVLGKVVYRLYNRENTRVGTGLVEVK